MSEGGRIPLWIVAVVAGMGVIAVVGIFFYGAYAGVGSAVQSRIQLGYRMSLIQIFNIF